MTIKEAIYYLQQKFNNRFRGIGSNFTTQTLSGTSATITATEDCWLCITGSADSGITVAPCIDIIINGRVATRGVGMTANNTAVVASTYLKEGTVATISAFRCKLTNATIYLGGGITLAIPMLSASERGCWRHEYQAGNLYALPESKLSYKERDKDSHNRDSHTQRLLLCRHRYNIDSARIQIPIGGCRVNAKQSLRDSDEADLGDSCLHKTRKHASHHTGELHQRPLTERGCAA